MNWKYRKGLKMKKIKKDLIIAICLIGYVLMLSLASTKMTIERLSKDIEVFSGAFLVLGLLGLEKAYKQDEGITAITAIELLVMSFYSLSIMHITTLIKCDFIKYMFFSAGAIGLYYILKIIIIYTKQRKEDLNKLSDISEIVKKDEPIKKEAKKRNQEENVEIEQTKKIDLNNSKNEGINNKNKNLKAKSATKTKTSKPKENTDKNKSSKKTATSKNKSNNEKNVKAEKSDKKNKEIKKEIKRRTTKKTNVKETEKKVEKEEIEKKKTKTSAKKKQTKKEVKEND